MKKLIALIIIAALCIPYTAQSSFESEEMKSINTANKLMESVVQVNVVGGQATGFFISKDTLITNQHVVGELKVIMITKKSGSMCITDVIKVDKANDLALLKAYCDGEPLKLANSVKVGQTLLTMGNPSETTFFLSKGIVSGLLSKQVLTDCYVDFGSSGSPMVNLEGEVIGVVTSKFHDKNVGAGANLDTVKQFIK